MIYRKTAVFLLALVLLCSPLCMPVGAQAIDDTAVAESHDYWSTVVAPAAEDIAALKEKDTDGFYYEGAYPVYPLMGYLTADTPAADTWLQEYYIVVPYRETNGFTLHYLLRRDKSGQWVLHNTYGGTPETWDNAVQDLGMTGEEYYADNAMFLLHPETVNAAIAASGLKNIEDIRFLFDAMTWTSYVYLVSEGVNYMIPFSASENKIKMQNGCLYTENECIAHLMVNYDPSTKQAYNENGEPLYSASAAKDIQPWQYLPLLLIAPLCAISIFVGRRIYRKRIS